MQRKRDKRIQTVKGIAFQRGNIIQHQLANSTFIEGIASYGFNPGNINLPQSRIVIKNMIADLCYIGKGCFLQTDTVSEGVGA